MGYPENKTKHSMAIIITGGELTTLQLEIKQFSYSYHQASTWTPKFHVLLAV